MIIGGHSILYSKMAGADREFRVAVHPSEKNDVHEFFLMTDDVEGLIADLTRRKIHCSPVRNQGWGLLTQVTLPGGGKLGIYQPRHARPKAMSVRKTAARRKTAVPAKKKKKKAPRRR